MSYYFVIVGPNDNPVFELDFQSAAKGINEPIRREDHRHLNQFIVHAALDIVDETIWSTPALYVVVDKFNEWFISAFVTAGSMKLMLLHDTRGNDDSVKSFFTEVYELYTKVLLNPFYEPTQPVTSQVFQHKVKLLAKKYL